MVLNHLVNARRQRVPHSQPGARDLSRRSRFPDSGFGSEWSGLDLQSVHTPVRSPFRCTLDRAHGSTVCPSSRTLHTYMGGVTFCVSGLLPSFPALHLRGVLGAWVLRFFPNAVAGSISGCQPRVAGAASDLGQKVVGRYLAERVVGRILVFADAAQYLGCSWPPSLRQLLWGDLDCVGHARDCLVWCVDWDASTAERLVALDDLAPPAIADICSSGGFSH